MTDLETIIDMLERARIPHGCIRQTRDKEEVQSVIISALEPGAVAEFNFRLDGSVRPRA